MALQLPAPGAEHAPRSSDTFLAIDNAAFESVENMSLSLCEARKYASNPILTNRSDGPDAWRAGFPWVLQDEGKFRMWYLARDASGEYFTCYAESHDGFHWTRPELNLVEHRGSKANNICYKGHTLFPSIFRDNKASDPARRYVATTFGFITQDRFNEAQKQRYGKIQPSIKCLAYSPDGLHWKEDTANLFPIHAKVEGGTLFRMGSEWFMAHQQNSAEYSEVHKGSRFISISSSKDLQHWQLGDKPGFFFDPKFSGLLQTHVTPGYQNYGNVIVAAQGLFYDNVELIDHETDLILILSNDGRRWRQPKPAQPLSYLLRRGDRGAWDQSFVVQGNLVSTGTKTLLYYNGSQWGNVDADGIQIGVAELRLDGYGSLAPHIGWEVGKDGPFEGIVTSKPVSLERPGLRLYLNVEAGHDQRDAVRVELCDASGDALEGFRFADCDVMNTSSVGLPVAWRGRADLSSLAGRDLRVKIRITAHNPERSGKVRVLSPQFYAFYFDTPQLLLAQEQAVFPSGVERQHLSDPNYPTLRGIDFVADCAAKVTMKSLRHDAAELTLSGNGKIRVSGKFIESMKLRGKTVEPKDGVWTFEAAGDESLEIGFTGKRD
jgi:hypothetical protein